MKRTSLTATVAALLLAGAAAAQLGPGPFAAFPTQSATDGRFLGFGCAGIATFEQNVTLGLAAPADDATFTVNFFDGDTGAGGAGAHWDEGNRQLIFSLYADPLRTGSTDPGNLIASWSGNDPNPTSGPLWTASAATMPDNDWWAATITNTPLAKAPSGNYFYNLVIGLDGSCDIGEVLESNVKVAASSPMTFLVPRFGLVAPLRQIENDGPILYPDGFPPADFDFVHAPTTYDGTFEFFLNLPGDENDLRLYDGDFDFGTAGPAGLPSGALLTPCVDFDDPDTPFTYSGFPFSTTGAALEGINSPGNPADDSEFDIFRRGEVSDPNRVGCVRYEVTDPDGNVYRNDNPSGSFEWEQFRIATPTAVDPADADHVAATDTLPGGIWKVKSIGLDLSNLNFWFIDSACATFSTPDGLEPACPAPGIYLVGDTVWRDSNNDGIQDPGEPGIPGVKLELFKEGGTAPIATAVTGDTSNPNWAACVANNTGLDLLGLYCFGVDEPGVYIIRVAAENFGPGGPLEGLTSTTGGEELTDEVFDDNVLFYDFGYHGPGKIGDRVWSDADSDGIQGFGETGINGVTLTLLDSGSNVLATQVTSGDGNYLFSDLPFGTYSVRVETTTLPPGSVQTYDFDGLGTPDIATAEISDAAESNVEVDFGYRTPVAGSLGDRVWNDLDADGVQDVGELGLNNVTVTLLDGANTVLATTVTSGDGNYTFANLSAGIYRVRVETATLPAGFVQTYDLDGLATPNIATVDLGSGENRTDVDFGYRNTGSLGDRVWNDTDADGVQDAGETGINGVTVTLLDNANNVLATTLTTGDGNYTFSNLAAGTYKVRVESATLPAGVAPTFDLDGTGTPHIATVSLATGENRTDVDFGYRGNGSLGDRVWKDTDADGIQDVGETGINGVTVTLLDGANNVLATTTTAGDGNYTFANLNAGTYKVRVESATLPAGLAPTFDLDGTGTPHIATVVLAAGQNRTDVDFGYRGTGSLGDRVWKDTDADGLQEAGETGINGVTVTLLDNANNVLAATTTSGDGNYTFSNLAAGTYKVRVESATLPAGLAPTFDLDGTGTPHIATASLAAGQNRTDVDFGYRNTGSLGDRVWNDADGDGVQDAGETGINGVTVTLLSGSTVLATTTTSGNGNYTFANLAAGTYTVRVESSTLPAGLAPTFDLDGTGTPHTATVALAAGQSRTDVDFGYRNTGSLGDRVWNDADGDGIQDASETGLNGVTVTLLSGSTVLATTITSGNGNYTFANLAAGTYTVRVESSTLPAGYTQTFDLDGTGTPHTATVTLAAGQSRTDVDFGYRAPVCAAGYFKDTFTTASFSNNEGTLSWSGAWIESDAAGTGVSSGNVTVGTPYSGYLILDDNPDTGTQPSAARQVNLSGFVSATLSFDFHTTGGTDPDDAAVIEISKDGGATYTVLETITGLTGTNIASRTYNITAYMASNTRIRFRISNLYGADDEMFKVDQVRIDGSCSPPTGSIGDRVWKDSDGDGAQDGSEPGLNGVTVQLLNSSNTVLATQTTSGNGNYLFSGLAAGTYKVKVVSSSLPAGYTQTFDLDGTGTAHVATVSLAAGQNRTDADFGYRPPACTAGYFKDTFTTASFSNNEGTLSWTGAWVESDVAGSGVSSGNVTVGTPYSGYLILDDNPDTGTEPSAARQANLSGFSSATLSFDFHTRAGVDPDDAVVVEVSKNGGTSYTVLETITGLTGTNIASRTYNITSYIASNTRIRFRVSNLYGGDDELFKVDQVRIDAACN